MGFLDRVNLILYVLRIWGIRWSMQILFWLGFGVGTGIGTALWVNWLCALMQARR